MPAPAKRKPRYPHWKVSTLIQAALKSPDEDRRWRYVVELHWRGDRAILEAAGALCLSGIKAERRLGADILGQLGIPDRTFPKEAGRILNAMLRREKSPAVLEAIVVAMGHTLAATARAPWGMYRRLLTHQSASVRDALAFALIGRDQPVAIRMLIQLSRDRAAAVRDWATFSLGTQTDVDTPVIRRALWARLTDRNAIIRGEALVGLARRKDPRILTACESLLGFIPDRLARETIAQLGDSRTRRRLRKLLADATSLKMGTCRSGVQHESADM